MIQTNKDIAYYYNQKANEMLVSGNYIDATEYYKKALSHMPEEVIFYHNIGVGYMLREDYLKALTFFEIAVEKGLELDEIKLYIALSLYKTRQYTKILKSLEPEENKNKIDFLIIKSKAALKVGNFQVARETVNQLKINGFDSQELELIEKMIKI